MNVLRAISTEGFGRLRYYSEIRKRLDCDRQFRPYFEQETNVLPRFYVELVRQELGPLWDWLPKGSLDHDANAYLKSERSRQKGVEVARPSPVFTGVDSPFVQAAV